MAKDKKVKDTEKGLEYYREFRKKLHPNSAPSSVFAAIVAHERIKSSKNG